MAVISAERRKRKHRPPSLDGLRKWRPRVEMFLRQNLLFGDLGKMECTCRGDPRFPWPKLLTAGKRLDRFSGDTCGEAAFLTLEDSEPPDHF